MRVAPGARIVQQSYTTHPWLVREVTTGTRLLLNGQEAFVPGTEGAAQRMELPPVAAVTTTVTSNGSSSVGSGSGIGSSRSSNSSSMAPQQTSLQQPSQQPLLQTGPLLLAGAAMQQVAATVAAAVPGGLAPAAPGGVAAAGVVATNNVALPTSLASTASIVITSTDEPIYHVVVGALPQLRWTVCVTTQHSRPALLINHAASIACMLAVQHEALACLPPPPPPPPLPHSSMPICTHSAIPVAHMLTCAAQHACPLPHLVQAVSPLLFIEPPTPSASAYLPCSQGAAGTVFWCTGSPPSDDSCDCKCSYNYSYTPGASAYAAGA